MILYVIGMDGLIADTKIKLSAEFEMKDLGMMHYFRHGGVAEYRWNLPQIREVCSIDPEKVWDNRLQDHDHTYGIEPEAVE